MAKVLVIHGAGMNMRGKVQTEIFGPMTLPEYDERIQGYAAELGLEIEIFHSNIEGEVINRIYGAHESGIDAAIINPAGYTSGHPALVAAITSLLVEGNRSLPRDRRQGAGHQSSRAVISTDRLGIARSPLRNLPAPAAVKLAACMASADDLKAAAQQ